MPKATGSLVTLTGDTWTQIANASQAFMFTVISGEILLRWSSTQPVASDPGHRFTVDSTFGDSATSSDEKAWAKASGNSAGSPASIVITK